MVTEAMLKTCWYCKTGRAEDGALAAMPIYKKVDFFETHAQQLLDVVKLYEPRKVNLATEIIQKAQSGGHWANYSVIAQIAELLAANQPALAALTQLQEKQYQERIGDIKFQTALMGVPRCPTCKKIHRRVNSVSADRICGRAGRNSRDNGTHWRSNDEYAAGTRGGSDCDSVCRHRSLQQAGVGSAVCAWDAARRFWL